MDNRRKISEKNAANQIITPEVVLGGRIKHKPEGYPLGLAASVLYSLVDSTNLIYYVVGI